MPATHITLATISRCIEEQYHAAECHLRAVSWMEFRADARIADSALRAATREQMIGAYHAEQARIRLDRINGHA